MSIRASCCLPCAADNAARIRDFDYACEPAIALYRRLFHNSAAATPPLFTVPATFAVMTPNRRKIHRAIVILALFVLAACEPTRPPPLGLDDAAHTLDAARAAGAATYAPLELRNAEQHLSEARARADKRDFDTALLLAGQSRVDSELA